MKIKIPKQRTIFRWIHIIVSIPIYGYIYSPFDKIPQYAFPARYIFFPLMVLTGLLMWKGHMVRQLISKRSVEDGSAQGGSAQAGAARQRATRQTAA